MCRNYTAVFLLKHAHLHGSAYRFTCSVALSVSLHCSTVFTQTVRNIFQLLRVILTMLARRLILRAGCTFPHDLSILRIFTTTAQTTPAPTASAPPTPGATLMGIPLVIHTFSPAKLLGVKPTRSRNLCLGSTPAHKHVIGEFSCRHKHVSSVVFLTPGTPFAPVPSLPLASGCQPQQPPRLQPPRLRHRHRRRQLLPHHFLRRQVLRCTGCLEVLYPLVRCRTKESR